MRCFGTSLAADTPRQCETVQKEWKTEKLGFNQQATGQRSWLMNLEAILHRNAPFLVVLFHEVYFLCEDEIKRDVWSDAGVPAD